MSNIILTAVPYLGGLIGGHLLHGISFNLNQKAAKEWGLSCIDLLGGMDLATVAKQNQMSIDYASKAYSKSPDHVLRNVFVLTQLTPAVREEISYRYILEDILLPHLFPQLGCFSLTRTCISSVLFSLRHLDTPTKPEQKAGQCINTLILGVICSLAKEKFGLLTAVFIHAGYNLHAFQNESGKNLTEILKSFTAEDPAALRTCIGGFGQDLLSPFYWGYQGCKKIGQSVLSCLKKNQLNAEPSATVSQIV